METLTKNLAASARDSSFGFVKSTQSYVVKSTAELTDIFDGNSLNSSLISSRFGCFVVVAKPLPKVYLLEDTG